MKSDRLYNFEILDPFLKMCEPPRLWKSFISEAFICMLYIYSGQGRVLVDACTKGFEHLKDFEYNLWSRFLGLAGHPLHAVRCSADRVLFNAYTHILYTVLRAKHGKTFGGGFKKCLFSVDPSLPGNYTSPPGDFQAGGTWVIYGVWWLRGWWWQN